MKKLMPKFFAALITLAFVITPALCTEVVTKKVYKTGFPDVDETHWAAREIKLLSQQSVIVGYPDGNFKPDDNVTRAEFASMAIKALGQENTNVIQPVAFTDITADFWAYDAIQKALYFELISTPKGSELFRPDDSVSRGEAITVSVNALTTEQITPSKAKEVLMKNYLDAKEVPQWFLIPGGKAEILSMLVVIPTEEGKKIEAERPATRAEVAAILFNMMEQAKLNPNKKLAEAMRKKVGDGFVVENALVQGSFGVIPAGSELPAQVSQGLSSQVSQPGEIYLAKAPQNLITKDRYILVSKGADFKGQLLDVRPGKLFRQNGVLVLQNDVLVTGNDQSVDLKATADVKMKKNRFMTFIRKFFKGEKVIVPQQGVVYFKTLEPLKIDLTNGWIIE